MEDSYINGAFNALDPDAMKSGFHPDFAIFSADGEQIKKYPIGEWVAGVAKKKDESGLRPGGQRVGTQAPDHRGNRRSRSPSRWNSTETARSSSPTISHCSSSIAAGESWPRCTTDTSSDFVVRGVGRPNAPSRLVPEPRLDAEARSAETQQARRTQHTPATLRSRNFKYPGERRRITVYLIRRPVPYTRSALQPESLSVRILPLVLPSGGTARRTR